MKTERIKHEYIIYIGAIVLIVSLIGITALTVFLPTAANLDQKTSPPQIEEPTSIAENNNTDTNTKNNTNITQQNNTTNTETTTQQDDTESGLYDLSDAEFEKIRQDVERKEEEILKKQLEEERLFVPLVDDADELMPLHGTDRIWLMEKNGAVVITGRVVLREGILELFACRTKSKEHESIISIRVMPELIHAALLAVGAEKGKPMQAKPIFIPPSGDEIEIKVRWKNENGITKESSAQEWIWDSANSPENNKKIMSTHWVFTGSMMYKDDEGKEHYLANETGELFGLSNFVGSILDVPIESSDSNDKLLFSCFTERIPPINTLVTIILKPTKKR